MLPAVGGYQDVIAHDVEQTPYFEPRGHDVLHECSREGAVRAVPIQRKLAILGGVDHERAAVRIDPGEPAADRTRAGRTAYLPRERVVAAGIEYHKAELPCTVNRIHHLFEWDPFEFDVKLGLERGVRRDQVVAAVHLDAMAGVI